MMSQQQFAGQGSEGVGYVWVAASDAGRVGYRTLEEGKARVRVEPFSRKRAEAMDLPGWKQPEEGNLRFSTVVYLGHDAIEAVTAGLMAIARGNPALPEVYDIVDLQEILSMSGGVKFNPAASEWGLKLAATWPEDEPPGEKVALPVVDLTVAVAAAEALAAQLRELRFPT